MNSCQEKELKQTFSKRMNAFISTQNIILLFFLVPVILVSVIFSFYKIAIILSLFVSIFLIIKIPEIGFSLFLLVGIIKGFTQNFPIDFTLLIFILTSFAMLYKLINKQYKIDLINKYVLFLFYFVLMLIISNLYTKSPNYGSIKTLTFSVFNSFLFLGGISIGLTKNSRMKFLKILHFIIFIYSIIYVYLLKDMIGMNFDALAEYNIRLSIMGNPIGVGRIFSILPLMSIIFLFYETQNYKKIYHYLSIILGLAITIATNSRGPFLALIISILFYLFFFAKIKKTKVINYLILISMLVVGIFTLLPETFISRYKLMGKAEVDIKEKNVVLVNTFKTRENYINQSIKYLKNNPSESIFGIGAGGFSFIRLGSDEKLYPHNIFVEILLELGLVGLLLFILPFMFLLKDFILTKRKMDQNEYIQIIFWIMLTVLSLINAQVSSSINGNRTLWFFQGGLVGFLIYLKKKYEVYKSEA